MTYDTKQIDYQKTLRKKFQIYEATGKRINNVNNLHEALLIIKPTSLSRIFIFLQCLLIIK